MRSTGRRGVQAAAAAPPFRAPRKSAKASPAGAAHLVRTSTVARDAGSVIKGCLAKSSMVRFSI